MQWGPNMSGIQCDPSLIRPSRCFRIILFPFAHMRKFSYLLFISQKSYHKRINRREKYTSILHHAVTVNCKSSPCIFSKHKSIENLATSLILSQSQLSAHCVPVPQIQRANIYRTKSRNLSHPQSELTVSPHIRGHVMSAEPPHPHPPPPILSSSSRLNLFASHMVSTGCAAPNYCPCQGGRVRAFRCDPWASVRVPSLLASIVFEMWLSWLIYNNSRGILLKCLSLNCDNIFRAYVYICVLYDV